MSKFTPTQAEKDALSYLDWDDAALGRFTKHVACTLEKIGKDEEGLRKVTAASCAMMLVGLAFDANAAKLKLTLDGHTHSEIPTGDWQITVKRIKGPEQSAEASVSPGPEGDGTPNSSSGTLT